MVRNSRPSTDPKRKKVPLNRTDISPFELKRGVKAKSLAVATIRAIVVN